MSDSRGVKRKRVESPHGASYVETVETQDASSNENDTKCDIQFQFDIVCSEDTESKFIKTNGSPILDAGSDLGLDSDSGSDSDYDAIRSDFSDQSFYDLIRKVVLEKLYDHSDTSIVTTDNTAESDYEDEGESSRARTLQLGDKVSVSYTPDSQRYIDHYNAQAFTGEVFFIDEGGDNFFMWNVDTGPLQNGQISLTYRVQSFKREGCHFFGMSDCYYGTYSFV
jgi:hypothetical protein